MVFVIIKPLMCISEIICKVFGTVPAGFFGHVSSRNPRNPLSNVQPERERERERKRKKQIKMRCAVSGAEQSSRQQGNITDLGRPDCGGVRDCPLIHLHPLAKYQK